MVHIATPMDGLMLTLPHFPLGPQQSAQVDHSSPHTKAENRLLLGNITDPHTTLGSAWFYGA